MNPELHGDVVEALRKAIAIENEIRLFSKAGSPGLLPAGGTKANVTEITAQSCDPERGLFEVRQTNEGSGRSVRTVHFVRITERGIEALFRSVSLDQIAKLIDSASPSNKVIAGAVQERLFESHLARSRSERDEAAKRYGVFVVTYHKFLEAQMADAREVRDRAEESIRELESQLAKYALPVAAPMAPPVAAPEPRRTSPPREEGDIDFQRDVAENLVYAWQDSGDRPEVREALERVMLNVGVDPVGEPGEVVSFDARIHKSGDKLKPGDRATVEECGWELTNLRGKKPLTPIRVRKSATPTEAAI